MHTCRSDSHSDSTVYSLMQWQQTSCSHTESTAGDAMCTTHLMLWLAEYAAACSETAAASTPNVVVPSSTTAPCMSTFTRLDADTSSYIRPWGAISSLSSADRRACHTQPHTSSYIRPWGAISSLSSADRRACHTQPHISSYIRPWGAISSLSSADRRACHIQPHTSSLTPPQHLLHFTSHYYILDCITLLYITMHYNMCNIHFSRDRVCMTYDCLPLIYGKSPHHPY